MSLGALRRISACAGVLALALFCGCEGGSSSETDGLVPDNVDVTPGQGSLSGRTDAGNFVGLYSAGYRPYNDSGFADTAKADAHGHFSFKALRAGPYNLVVRHSASGKAAFIGDLTVDAGLGGSLKSAKLTRTGSLRGAIRDSLPLVSPKWVYLPGTPFQADVGIDGGYVFAGIPAGNYQLNRFWRHALPCPTICGGLEEVSDSAQVRIESGVETGDPP